MGRRAHAAAAGGGAGHTQGLHCNVHGPQADEVVVHKGGVIPRHLVSGGHPHLQRPIGQATVTTGLGESIVWQRAPRGSTRSHTVRRVRGGPLL